MTDHRVKKMQWKTNAHRMSCALLATLPLLACVGPRPVVPQGAAVSAPAQWRASLTSTSPMTTDWWRQFGDPRLTALVDRALANNSDVGVAIARVQEARALARLAGAQESALATIGANGSESRTILLGHGLDQLAGQPQVTISYDFDFFGRLSQATASAQATLLATAASRDAVALAIASTTATTYITLLGMDARLATTRATLAERADALRLARRLAEAGYSSQLELRQSEAEYEAAEQLIPAAELAITREENALSVLLGDAPGPIDRDRSLDQLVDPTIPEGLPSSLLRRRPDLVAAEESLVASDRTLDSARAAQLPDFSLTGGGGTVFSTALTKAISVYSLGAGIVSPLFDGGRLRSRSAAAAARRDQAAFAYRKAALNAFREVNDSLSSVQRLEEQEIAVRKQIVPLRDALRIATNRYREGYSPYLDQIDAERGLLTAQLVEIQIKVDRLNAYVTLYQAMGGGWQNPSESTTRSVPVSP
jgi:outer membrane protein, multidrug efflux system